MNRRTFLTSLIAAPAGVALAVKAQASQPEYYWQVDSTSFHRLLRKCGEVVEKPLDLDEVFQRVYELKRHRNREPQLLYWRNRDGSLSPLNCYYP